jgi:succinyl-diaminopimelate desuccinylase
MEGLAAFEDLTDPVPLARDLIRCPSVTPEDAGALGVLAAALERLGFCSERLFFEETGTAAVHNLYAQLGSGGRHFCFAGHTDVVPVGDAAAWSVDPFAGTIENGVLYGRGAADMKSAIAAFVAAVARHKAAGRTLPGTVSLLITGDEEGPAVNGTAKMLKWLNEKGITIDACVVGEPTNPLAVGEMMKIGRRGSLSGILTVYGAQGHVAYPHLADNPIPRLIKMLAALSAEPLDQGSAHFQPSNLEITSVDVGNSATNVIPAQAVARFNIRFNDRHTSGELIAWLRATLDAVGGAYDLATIVSGESFLTAPGALVDLVRTSVEEVTGRAPELSTTGGTSDARFIAKVAPVVEFGLVGQTMHKVDERAKLADIETLTQIYERMLTRFFAAG